MTFLFLIPAVRLLVFKHYTLLTSFITYNSEIMSPCSYYVKTGLVYIVIADLFSYQPFFCSEYTKLNTCILCNIHSVSFNKCIFLTCFASL